jgi:hypothetical protein
MPPIPRLLEWTRRFLFMTLLLAHIDMSSATDQPTDAQGDPIEQEIGHDEFDPKGTLALILIYFLIIAGLWAFMYFVEFLGNGPTVV